MDVCCSANYQLLPMIQVSAHMSPPQRIPSWLCYPCLPAMWETWVRSLGWEDPLEEGMATQSSILAWRIPMDRGAWGATVHGVAKSRTQLKRLSSHTSKNNLRAPWTSWSTAAKCTEKGCFFSHRSQLSGAPPATAGLSAKQVFRDKQAEGLSFFRWEVLLLKLFKPVFFFLSHIDRPSLF